MSRRERNPEREREERDRFIVLLHVWSLSADGTGMIPLAQIARHLAFTEEEVRELVDGLLYHAFLAPIGGGSGVAIGALGAEYVQRTAGRRRSLRLPGQKAPRAVARPIRWLSDAPAGSRSRQSDARGP